MIPVIGVPILNGFHWLQRLVNSIDFPVNKLIVLNNNREDTDLTNNLNNLSNTQHTYIKNIQVCHLPSNIGVAASWNLIIQSNIEDRCWLITNHDIAFTPGLLQEFFYYIEQDYDIIYGSGGDFGDGGYDLFLIKDTTIQKIGLFDNNFYPAYCEDADYIMRIHRYNQINTKNHIKHICLNIPYYHGPGLSSDPDSYIQNGSQTLKTNNYLCNKLREANIKNFEYMNKKWGEGWRITSPWNYPMNIENMPITYTSYDLNFCRSKHISINEEEKMTTYYNDNNPDQDNGIITTNKFIINSKSESRFFVVDNFYQDPMGVREFALNQNYFPGEGAVGHRTRKQFLFDGLKEKFEQIIGQNIPDHTEDGYGWKDIGINGRFQHCPAGTNLVYHCDVQKWAAMIFLTPDPPPTTGTSFFRHKNTKIYHKSQIDWETTGDLVFNQKTFLDRSPYELTDSIGNMFNRLVIFDGGLIHSASDYFGWDIHSSRLFHIFFFN